MFDLITAWLKVLFGNSFSWNMNCPSKQQPPFAYLVVVYIAVTYYSSNVYILKFSVMRNAANVSLMPETRVGRQTVARHHPVAK